MRSCNSGFNIFYRLLAVSFFIAAPLMSNAQDIPCVTGDNNPWDNACPLDTWVIILVVVAGIFAAIHLHKKQRSSQV